MRRARRSRRGHNFDAWRDSVGSNADAQKYEGKGTRTIDLKGETVLPGLTDAHYHLIGVGQREMTLNLEGTTSLEDFLTKVKARVDRAKPGEWVTGRGWIETFWTPPVFPTRQDLDRISPNNPVFLRRADGHGAVANSAAYGGTYYVDGYRRCRWERQYDSYGFYAGTVKVCRVY